MDFRLHYSFQVHSYWMNEYSQILYLKVLMTVLWILHWLFFIIREKGKPAMKDQKFHKIGLFIYLFIARAIMQLIEPKTQAQRGRLDMKRRSINLQFHFSLMNAFPSSEDHGVRSLSILGLSSGKRRHQFGHETTGSQISTFSVLRSLVDSMRLLKGWEKSSKCEMKMIKERNEGGGGPAHWASCDTPPNRLESVTFVTSMAPPLGHLPLLSVRSMLFSDVARLNFLSLPRKTPSDVARFP